MLARSLQCRDLAVLAVLYLGSREGQWSWMTHLGYVSSCWELVFYSHQVL